MQGVGPTKAALRPGCSWSTLLCTPPTPTPARDLPNRLFSSPSASREVRSELRAWGSQRRGEGDRLFGAMLCSSCCSAVPRAASCEAGCDRGSVSGSLEPPTLALQLVRAGGILPSLCRCVNKGQGCCPRSHSQWVVGLKLNRGLGPLPSILCSPHAAS